MAYVNATINEGGFGSFIATEAITLYQRVKFVTTALAAGDGKVGLAVAGATERGDAIAMQPIDSGAFGTVRFLNAQGEQFGQATEAIALGGAVYTDASWQLQHDRGRRRPSGRRRDQRRLRPGAVHLDSPHPGRLIRLIPTSDPKPTRNFNPILRK
jgi:hypothetical protein